MYSLLQKKPTVQTKPYPHIIIEDALPWDLYEELEKTFPKEQIINTITTEDDDKTNHKNKENVRTTFKSQKINQN